MPRLEIPELSKSKKNRWGKCNTLTSAYGHGVSTTLLQLTRAYAAIVNGGVLLDSSILLNKKLNKKRVISKETSVIMNQMLRANVDKKNKTSGSGRKADIVGYDVLGKTGTAQKPSKKEKGYSKEILNVFASAFKKPEKFSFNTGINGGNRAIVPVGSYEEIIPLDILMTQLLKALVVGDIEVAIDLGMLELTAEDLALATYVCPSKYDYCSILMDNLNKVYEGL